MPADRREVRRLLQGAEEAERGVDLAEFEALETFLGYVYDDALAIPEDPDERDKLIAAFVTLGWCRVGCHA
jgi:hypothetical protein